MEFVNETPTKKVFISEPGDILTKIIRLGGSHLRNETWADHIYTGPKGKLIVRTFFDSTAGYLLVENGSVGPMKRMAILNAVDYTICMNNVFVKESTRYIKKNWYSTFETEIGLGSCEYLGRSPKVEYFVEFPPSIKEEQISVWLNLKFQNPKLVKPISRKRKFPFD